MKKTNVTKSIKKNSSKKAITNHLQPIDTILSCMEECEMKLKNLFDTIPTKLEKLVSLAKTKVTKALEQQKKATTTLKSAQAAHKAKANKLTHLAVKKAEKSLSDIAKFVGSIKTEHAELQAQLLSCKEMKKIFSGKDKLTTKKNNVKKAARKKQSLKKET